MAPRSTKLETEAYLESWQRFEAAIDAAIKSGPKHRPAAKPKKPKRSRRASSSKSKP